MCINRYIFFSVLLKVLIIYTLYLYLFILRLTKFYTWTYLPLYLLINVVLSFQDYPSIGQIQSKIKERKIHVIFAVNESYLTTYENLAAFFIGSSATALKNNSANILQVIQSNYDVSIKIDFKFTFFQAISFLLSELFPLRSELFKHVCK